MMGLNDYAISLIRTGTPVVIGAVLAWVAVHFGLHASGPQAQGLTAAATAIITAVYYALVRAAERKYPWLGILLGHPAKPSYVRVK